MASNLHVRLVLKVNLDEVAMIRRNGSSLLEECLDVD